MSKTVTVLGSTGSIGTQALEVIEMQGYEVKALTASVRVDEIEKQIRKFKPDYAAMVDEKDNLLLIGNPFSIIVYIIVNLSSELCFIALVQASDTATFKSSISSMQKPTLFAIPEVVNLIILTYAGLAVISILIVS